MVRQDVIQICVISASVQWKKVMKTVYRVNSTRVPMLRSGMQNWRLEIFLQMMLHGPSSRMYRTNTATDAGIGEVPYVNLKG